MARTGHARPDRRHPAADGLPHQHHRDGSDCVRDVHSDGSRRRHRDPGRCDRHGHHHDPVPGRGPDRVHDPVAPVARPIHPAAHRCHRRDVRRAVRGRHAHGDDVHGRVDGHRGRDGPAAGGDRHTDDRGSAPDAPRCWRADWPAGRRHDRIDRRCPDEDARRPDRRTQEASSTPVEARTAAQDGVRRVTRHEARYEARYEAHWARHCVIRREGRAEPAGRPVRRGPEHRRRRRPLDDAGADRGADEAPRRALPPSAAVGRHPSARAPTVHRDTDCHPHRHRGTARHWCGCGEWGVCVRSFENCEWYSGLRSDLEGSATPQPA